MSWRPRACWSWPHGRRDGCPACYGDDRFREFQAGARVGRVGASHSLGKVGHGRREDVERQPGAHSPFGVVLEGFGRSVPSADGARRQGLASLEPMQTLGRIGLDYILLHTRLVDSLIVGFA